MTNFSKRKIISQAGGLSPTDSARITNLENNELKVLYYASISAATGTITAPANTTIILNDFPQGLDAVCETIVNGEPSGLSAVTAGGATITVSSFDASGNYTLSGTPSAYPVALLYVLKVKELYYSGLTFDNIIESQAIGVYAPIASPTFTGVPSAPTAAVGTSTTQLSTTAFVSANEYVGVQCFFSSTNLVDSTNYYFGTFVFTLVTASSPSRRFRFPFTGKIIAVYFIGGSAVATSSQDCTLILNNITTPSSVSLGSVRFDNVSFQYDFTGLAISGNIGDQAEFQLTVPALTTNGSGSLASVQVIFKKD